MVRAHHLAPSIRVKRVGAIRRFVVFVRNTHYVGQARTPHSLSSVFPTSVCPMTTLLLLWFSVFQIHAEKKGGKWTCCRKVSRDR